MLQISVTGEWQSLVTNLADTIGNELRSPWFYYQCAIIAVAALLAHLLGTWAGKRINLTDRTLGWPVAARLSMRALVASISIAFLAIMLFVIRLVMIEATWPSRSYLIGVALNLSTAWIIIRILASAIRNPNAVRVIALAAWIIAALSILDLLNPLVATLDSVAFTLGGQRISPLFVLKAIAVLGFALWIATFIGNFLETRVSTVGDLTPSIQVLIGKLLRMALIVIAVLVAMAALGVDLSVFALLSGAIGVGVGFGLQKVVGNFISGIILLADKSIKPGDLITVGDSFGRVSAMNTRYLSLAAVDGREILIPNEDLITQKVVNWTYSNPDTLLNVDFGVSYESDPFQIRQLAIDTALAVPRVIKTKPPVCHLTGFGDSSLNFRLHFWIQDPGDGLGNVRSEVMLALWRAFKEAGVDIPYPIRDVRVRSEPGAMPPPAAEVAPRA